MEKEQLKRILKRAKQALEALEAQKDTLEANKRLNDTISEWRFAPSPEDCGTRTDLNLCGQLKAIIKAANRAMVAQEGDGPMTTLEYEASVAADTELWRAIIDWYYFDR